MTYHTQLTGRLLQQLEFIQEIDRLKQVMRRSQLIDAQRFENSAEHSWHVALMALLLAEYADEAIDLLRVVQMLLIHDVVEIDAGDTYAYDEAARESQQAREQQAAQRLFGLLPADQAALYEACWHEFDAGESAEARFANAIDRLMPLLHNYRNRGAMWQQHDVRRQQVIERLAPIGHGSATLWQAAEAVIEDAVAQGFLAT